MVAAMERYPLLKALLAAGAALTLFGAPAEGAPAEAHAPLRAQWVGGPTLLFRFGPILIVTDPVLGEGGAAFRMIDPNSGAPDAVHARLAPLPELDLGTADLVLLSHDHGDHLDEAALAALSARPFIAPPAQVGALRARGLSDVSGLPWRGSHLVSKNGYSVCITAVPAQHSERPAVSELLGDVNGYWLEFRHRHYRRTVYWTGDSFPVPAELGSDVRHPDLLVPHLGAVGEGGPFGQVSMGARQALSFARTVEPKAVLPIHHSTFSLYREPIERFEEAAAGEPWKLERLAEGGELVLP